MSLLLSSPYYLLMSNETANKTLVLFDFDGTITRTDTLLHFLFFTTPWFLFLFRFLYLVPTLIMYKIGFISNDVAKIKLLAVFFKGKSETFFVENGQKFATEKLPSLIKTEAQKIIDTYRQQQATIFVVTASLRYWLEPWCKKNDISLICTELQFVEGHFSGSYNQKNCNGEEKLIQIQQRIDLSSFRKIVAYGDSRYDLPMLSLATHPHFRQIK